MSFGRALLIFGVFHPLAASADNAGARSVGTSVVLGRASAAATFMPTATMLDNMDMRMRSLRLTGPNDARSGAGWLMLRAGSRVCFDVDTALLPRCNVRLYYDNITFLKTDSPFFALYLGGYWLQLPPRTPDTCGLSVPAGTIITHQPVGARTRACLCTSDGGSPATYAWQNLATGTVGTSTTCDP